ncbi:hypothetical protein RBB50_003303 [Rhinocladiella similis]
MSAPSRVADAHVNPKDPRLHWRTVLNDTSKATSGPAPEKNNSPVVEAGIISEMKVQHASGSSAVQPPLIPNSADRETAMMTIIYNAVDGRLVSRKREHAERSLQKARVEHERLGRTHSQFPLMVHQSAQILRKAEEAFQAAQQAVELHSAADESRLEEFLRIFVDEPVKKLSECEVKRAELDDLRQELKAMQTQVSSVSETSKTTAAGLAKVTVALAKISTENEELVKRASDQDTTIKTLTAQLNGLQNSYKELANTVKGNADTVKDTSKATESMLLGSEEYRKSNKLMSMAIKGDLSAVTDRVSNLEHVASEKDNKSRDDTKFEDLRKELGRLQESSEARDRAANATTNEVESLKKSTDAQSESIRSVMEEITTQRSEFQTLSTNIDQFKSEVSQSTVDHQASILTSVASKIDDRIDPQNAELELIKANIERHASQLKRIEEDLVNPLRESMKEVEDSLKASQDNALSIERIENELKSKATAFEKEVLDVRKSPRPASQASMANDSSTTALTPIIQELEARTEQHQQSIAIVSHQFRWLDHRFNNLETSKLHRAILKSLDPLLPKFEQGLMTIIKLDEGMRKTQARIDGIASKLEGDLLQLRSEVETRSSETKEKQDNMREAISGIQSAQLRFFTDTSHNNEKISAINDELGEIRRLVQRLERATRSSPDPDVMGFSIKGSHERATAQSARSRRPDRGRGGSQPRYQSNRGYDDRDSADELNPECSEQTHSALLEQFQATATKSIHSPDPRSPLMSSMRGREPRPGKRKHSETDSPSRNDRRT